MQTACFWSFGMANLSDNTCENDSPLPRAETWQRNTCNLSILSYSILQSSHPPLYIIHTYTVYRHKLGCACMQASGFMCLCMNHRPCPITYLIFANALGFWRVSLCVCVCMCVRVYVCMCVCVRSVYLQSWGQVSLDPVAVTLRWSSRSPPLLSLCSGLTAAQTHTCAV